MMKRDRIENKKRSSFIACVRCGDTGVVSVRGGVMRNGTHKKEWYYCTCAEGRHKAREAPMRIEPYPCNLTCVVRHEEDGA